MGVGAPSNTTLQILNYAFGAVGGVVGALLVAPNVGLTATEDNVWIAGLVAGMAVIPLQAFWNKQMGVQGSSANYSDYHNQAQPSANVSDQQLAEHEAIGLTLFSSGAVGGLIMYQSGASLYQSVVVGVSSAFTSLGPAYYSDYMA